MLKQKQSSIVCSLSALALLLSPQVMAASGKQGAKATQSSVLVKRQAEPAFRERLFKGKLSADAAAGEKQLLSGKYDAAANTFKKALNSNSKDLASLCGLGFALAVQFKLDGADQQFNKALNINAGYPLAHVGKAFVTINRLQSSSMTIIKQRNSMLSYAESECKKALDKDPGLPEALLILGMVQKEQGRLNEALASFNQSIKGDPKFSQAYTQKGLIELQQNNLAAAEQDLLTAIRLRSSNSTAHFGLGRVYLAENQANAALKEFNTALYLNPNSAPVQIALGDAYRMQKNYNAAIAAYQKAVLIKSENEAAYLGLADIREERGDLELALAELRSGIELNKNSLPLHLRVGDIALKLEKTDIALKEYTTCLQLSPACSEAAKGMVRAYVIKAQKEANGAFFMSNNYEAAEAMLKQAIAMNPNDMELALVEAKFRSMSGKPVDLNSLGVPSTNPQRLAYAEALTAQFRYDEASQQVNTVLANTNDAKQLLAVADISLMNRDLDSAAAAYNKAAALPDASARAKRGIDAVAKAREEARKELTFAEDLARKKQLASAIDRYRNAAYLNPRLADAHLGLADALKKFFSKRPPALREAAQHYRAYVSLSPNLPEKEKEKILKRADNLVEKAYKIERKQAVSDNDD